MNRKTMMGIAALAAMVAGGCNWFGPEQIKLAENGKPLADIVIAADAGRSVRFGAEEIKWHLKKATGADFAVVTDAEKPSGRYEIRIGESKRTKAKKGDFQFQQYLVEVGAEATELVGWDDDVKINPKYPPIVADEQDGSLKLQSLPGLFDKHGSLYAVYQFLEEVVGVKWVDCTDYGTLIPSDPSLAIKTFSKRYEPFAGYRGGTYEYGLDSDCWSWRSPEHKDFQRMAYRDVKKIRQYGWLYMLRHRAGGRYAQCNHSLYYFYNFYLNKNASAFKEYHPEYFSKGGPEGSEPTQLCYTRQDVVDRVAADISSYFNATNANKVTPMYSSRDAMGTTVKYWGDDNCALEPMDNGGMCKCPECQKLLDLDKDAYGPGHAGDSTLWFSFVKRVAEKLLVTNPGCTITTLAYGGHEPLPKNVTLPKNVQVIFCPSGNRGGPRGEHFAKQMARMAEWRSAYPDQPMGVWFYSGFPYEGYNNSRRQGVHGFYAHEAKKQYMRLKELNARQGVFQCGLEGALEQYVNFALLLVPETDIEQLMNEYFSQFGAAAKDLREFYDIVEDRYCNLSYRNPTAAGAEQDWVYICPPAVMEKLGAIIARAEKRQLSDVERQRVALFKHANWTYMKTGAEKYLSRARAPQPTWNAVKVPNAQGDFAKVAWDKVPLQPMPMFDRGTDQAPKVDWKCEYRVANDDQWIYVEMVQNRPSTLTADRGQPGIFISPGIGCFDTWEFVLAEKRAMPYRYMLCGHDKATRGRIKGWSYGEINFRMDVPSAESGLENFGIKFDSDISSGKAWRCRWALPMATMLAHPLKPGDAFYFCPVSVLHPGACGGLSPYGIFGPVSFTTVRTYDRGIEIKTTK